MPFADEPEVALARSRLEALPSRWRYAPSILIDGIVALVDVIQLGGFIALLCALISRAQNPTADPSLCASRVKELGFSGNSDFYGLGIRLGIYLQWWASLIANLWLPDDWQASLAAYLVFSSALIIALTISTFQHTCLFTAEVIVVLFIYWGGFIGVVYSTKTMKKAVIEGTESQIRFSVGLSAAMITPIWISIAFSTWFWIRLATAGEVDFLATPGPGGTFYFVFARVSSGTKAAARFNIFLCLWYSWALVSDFFIYTAVYTWTFASDVVRWSRKQYNALGMDILSSYAILLVRAKHRKNRQEEEDNKGNGEKIFFGIFCTSVIIYTTIAIELTLAWNSISDIYSISSAGQVIPLIAGFGLLINAIWKLKLWKGRIYIPELSLEIDDTLGTNRLNEARELEEGIIRIASVPNPNPVAIRI